MDASLLQPHGKEKTLKSFVAAKIQHICVTDKSVTYHGSVSIDEHLMEEAGISPYEQVHVVNLSNGARWITYALPAGQGVFTLNGGGARLGEIGDKCVIMTFRLEETYSGAKVVYCTEENNMSNVLQYHWKEEAYESSGAR